MPARKILTGVGPLEVEQPRVDHRGLDEAGGRQRFRSEILPPYLRKTKAVDDLIAWLYLKGVSTGDFFEALPALLGPDAKGLLAPTYRTFYPGAQGKNQPIVISILGTRRKRPGGSKSAVDVGRENGGCQRIAGTSGRYRWVGARQFAACTHFQGRDAKHPLLLTPGSNMRRRGRPHLDQTRSRKAIGSEALALELSKEGWRGIAGWGAGLERIRRLAAFACAVSQDAIDDARIRNYVARAR